jgi:hypothetical protein
MTAIWWRVLQQGEFFSLERTKDAGPDGGGGAGYIEVPKTLTVKALQFFEQDLLTRLTSNPSPMIDYGLPTRTDKPIRANGIQPGPQPSDSRRRLMTSKPPLRLLRICP